MTSEQELREKLRKISALFEGATTIGERTAAAAAIHSSTGHHAPLRFGTAIPRGSCAARTEAVRGAMR